MATAKGGLTVAIKFTPQAVGDNISLYEDEMNDGGQSLTNTANAAENILANDGGGAAAQIMAVISGDKVADVKDHLATYVDLANFSGPKADYMHAAVDKGTVDLDASGNVTFNSSLDFNYLAAGEPAEVGTFTYIIRMSNGAFSVTTAKVTIIGQNDVPIAVADTGCMTEDSAPKTFNILANDTKDVDHTALNNVTVDSVTVVGPDGVTLANTDASAAPTTGNDITVALGSAFQALAAGEHATVTVGYTLHGDQPGDVSSTTLTVDVVGVNDDATIDGTHTGSVTEDGTTSTNGNVQVHDVDHGQSVFQTVSGSALHGTYGDFTFNSNTGDWTYALRNGDQNVQDLTSSDHVTDALTVTSLDGTAHQDITVTINGADETTTPVLPPSDPHGPTGIVFDISGSQAGNNLPNLGKFVGTGDDSPTDTFTWSVVANDSHIKVDAASGQLTATGIDPGLYTLAVTATDPDAAANPSATGNFVLYVGEDQGSPSNPPPSGSADTMVVTQANTIVAALSGNDTITGSSNVDYVLGGSGDDTIVGGAGADILQGGPGKNVFTYLAASDSPYQGGDKIYSFSHTNDSLDFSALGINSSQVTVSQSGADTIVQADINGGGMGSGDLEITLVGVNVAASDIDIKYS